LPGMVKPTNIRNTHFSRNPKIAAFLKAYHYVKEYGEGVDRIYRELEANGIPMLSFRTDDFILKITVPKIVESELNRTESEPKRTESELKRTEKEKHLTSKVDRVIEKASLNGERLSDKRIKILQLMEEDPYISKTDLGKVLGLHPSSVWRNIEAMRGKYLRRVGPDNGGFWEILE